MMKTRFCLSSTQRAGFTKAAFCALLIGAAACAPMSDADGPAENVRATAPLVDNRELVVLLSDGQSEAGIQTAISERGYLLREQASLSGLGLRMFTLEIPEGVTGKAAIGELETLVPTSTAGINHAFRTPKAASALEQLQYTDDMLGWPSSGCWAVTPVGLIDTLVDVDAPALAGVTTKTAVFTDDDLSNTRHGTDVALILSSASRLRGVEIYNAAVVGETVDAGQAAGVDSIAKAMDWLIENDVRLVNISLTGPYNKILDRSLQSAVDRGMVIVAAVGNAGAEAAPLYPAAFDRVLAVTAIDAETDIYADAVRGEHVDLSAPGVDVFLGEEARSRFATGTSIAAPFVTARIAADAMLSGGASVGEVQRSLAESATDLGQPGVDSVYGAGLVTAPSGCRS